MTINCMRTMLDTWCTKRGDCELDPCTHCPVGDIENVCTSYSWENAPEDLVKKAYLLAFGKIKEDKQMNITADDIRKAALELIWKRTQSSATAAATATATTVESYTYGYILGVGDLVKKMTEDDAE